MKSDGSTNAVFALCAVAAVVLLLVARVAGPTDLWDQTQPKTIAYTSDIVAHADDVRHWILPIERGELPATKPPLYNWLAAPGVAAFGYDSEIAHKLPSVVALIACFLLVVVVGRRILSPRVGWLAAMMFVACYPTFKLGYLARPDMLLVLWLFIAWCTATRMLLQSGPQSKRTGFDAVSFNSCLIFWFCIGLAALTKGPAAIVGVVYLAVAAFFVGSGWKALLRSGFWWGVPLVVLMYGGWLLGVGLIDPDHLYEKLWYAEIWGRITGSGPEGGGGGLAQWLTSLPNMLFYFAIRFAPWSIGALGATIVLTRRKRWKQIDGGTWLVAAMLFVWVVIGLYSLSAGKRADYLAPCYPMAAFLAAWWIVIVAERHRWTAWCVPILTGVVLAAMTIVNAQEHPKKPSSFQKIIDRAVTPVFHEDASAPS